MQVVIINKKSDDHAETSSKGLCYQVIPPYDCERVCDGLQLGGGGDHWGEMMVI